MKPDERHRFAMYWAAGCGGCDISVLNIHEALLDFAERFEIVFWPAVMDAKYADLEAMPDASIDLALFTGGIRNTENVKLARLLRRKSALLVAFGSCATEGCIPGLANLRPIDELLCTAFEGPTTDNPDRLRPVTRWYAPEGELHLPEMSPFVRTLEQVVPVDYFVPGCPPESERIADVLGQLMAALDGKAALPPTRQCPGRWPLDRVRRVPSRPRDQADRPVRAHPGPRASRRRPVPPGARHPLQRTGDARRMRREVPRRRGAVHRLLRRRQTASSTSGPDSCQRSPRSSMPTSRPRSTASLTACPIQSASSTASAWPDPCCEAVGRS